MREVGYKVREVRYKVGKAGVQGTGSRGTRYRNQGYKAREAGVQGMGSRSTRCLNWAHKVWEAGRSAPPVLYPPPPQQCIHLP